MRTGYRSAWRRRAQRSRTARIAVPLANSFANGPTATFKMGDVATAPVDGVGQAINLNQSAAQAAARCSDVRARLRETA
jgi:hypothetical protein